MYTGVPSSAPGWVTAIDSLLSRRAIPVGHELGPHDLESRRDSRAPRREDDAHGAFAELAVDGPLADGGAGCERDVGCHSLPPPEAPTIMGNRAPVYALASSRPA